jgi:uncharacterized protein YjiK
MKSISIFKRYTHWLSFHSKVHTEVCKTVCFTKPGNVLAIILVISCCLFFSCKPFAKKNKTPVEYDLNKPEKFIMPGNLLEISGISFHNGNKDTVYAIQDEEGKIFRLAWGIKKSYPTKFGKNNDYEDLTIINEIIYVLRSDGTIFTIPLTELTEAKTNSVREWKNILPKSEYEGIYGDEASNKLYVLCKKCQVDDNTKKVSGYILDTKDSLVISSLFSIDVTSLKGFTKKLNPGYKPSALAQNPITNEWFILSGSNKLLVIAYADWRVKEVYPLNGNLFNQAEGMAFDEKGNLYISNEGEEETNGNILFFERK